MMMYCGDNEWEASSAAADGVEMSSFRDNEEHVATILTDKIHPYMEHAPENKYRIDTLCKLIIFMIILVLVGSGVVAHIAFPGSSNAEGKENIPPKSVFDSLFQALSAATEDDPLIERNSLLDPMSSQYLALEWLSYRDGFFTSFEDTQAIKQRFALATLFYASGIMIYDEWLQPGVSECQFIGVTCDTTEDDRNAVVELHMIRVAMTGSLPDELGWLSDLRLLDMTHNRLRGSIPKGLSHLPNLASLELANNQMDGPLLALPPNLQALNIEHNFFYGQLPEWSLSLQAAKVGFNRFTGFLPKFEMGNELFHLDLSDTLIAGTLPPSIGKATNLIGLGISQTKLSGKIPTEIGLLTKLEQLSMSKTKLEGSLPDELFHATNLQSIIATQTQFSGTLSTLIENLTDLQVLNLIDGQLTGTLPIELGALSKLMWLQLAMNEWSGTIPSELAQATSLRMSFLKSPCINGCRLGRLLMILFLFSEKIWLQGTNLEGSVAGALCDLPSAALDFRTDCRSGKVKCDCCTECS
jgi:hypothetical protein